MVRDDVSVHFSRTDPVLFSIFQTQPFEDLTADPESSFFVNLCRSIVGQQLSVTVADVIFGRFEQLVPRPITPDAVLAVSDDQFRSIGMSYSKIRYVKDLATQVGNGNLRLSELSSLSDDRVIEELTRVKGIGVWTAEMFLMFTLGRPDVFSFGDLGLKRAIQLLYRMKKEPSMTTMKRLSLQWKPYRTYAALALWNFKDG